MFLFRCKLYFCNLRNNACTRSIVSGNVRPPTIISSKKHCVPFKSLVHKSLPYIWCCFHTKHQFSNFVKSFVRALFVTMHFLHLLPCVNRLYVYRKRSKIHCYQSCASYLQFLVLDTCPRKLLD